MTSDDHRVGWTESADGTDGDAVTVTHTVGASQTPQVEGFEAVVTSGTTTQGVTIELKSGSDVLWKTALKSGATVGDRAGLMFPRPIKGTPGVNITLEVSDPGTSGTITGNIIGSSK